MAPLSPTTPEQDQQVSTMDGLLYLCIIIFGLTYSGNWDPGNDEKMNGGLWSDIPESQTLIKKKTHKQLL